MVCPPGFGCTVVASPMTGQTEPVTVGGLDTDAGVEAEPATEPGKPKPVRKTLQGR